MWLNDRCATLLIAFQRADEYRRGSSFRSEGWPIEAALFFNAFAFLAELFSMRYLTAQFHFTVLDQVLLSLILAGCALGTGFVLGEIVYHRRFEPEYRAIQALSVIAIVVIAISLWVFETIAHFTRGQPRFEGFNSGLEAATFGIVSLVLLVVPTVISCYREAWETGRARWHAAAAGRALKKAEGRRDLAYYEYMGAARGLEDEETVIERAIATTRYDALRSR